jgi:hypothetical protein
MEIWVGTKMFVFVAFQFAYSTPTVSKDVFYLPLSYLNLYIVEPVLVLNISETLLAGR